MSRRREPRSWVRTLLLAVAVTTGRVAHADDADVRSEELMKRGVELRLLGRDREALTAFEAAHAISPTPHSVAQIALARQALGEWVEAEKGFEEAVRASEDPWVLRYHDALEQSLNTVRGHLGWLYVEANVPGEYLIDGAEHGTVPMAAPERIAVGTVQLEVRAPGYVSWKRTVSIDPGAQAHLVVVFQAVPAANGRSGWTPLPTQTNARRESAPAAVEGTGRRPSAYIALGAGGLLAAGGVVAWRVHESAASVYNDDGQCRYGALTRAERCGSNADTAHVALGLEIGAFAGAAASLALGAWLFFLPRARAADAVATRCVLSGAPGIACGGQF